MMFLLNVILCKMIKLAKFIVNYSYSLRSDKMAIKDSVQVKCLNG